MFVSSLALIFKITGDGDNINESLVNAMRDAEYGETGRPLFTTATTTGLIVFFVFALQCISTIAITRKETGGWRIPILQIVFYSGIAYLFTFLTVNGLNIIGIN